MNSEVLDISFLWQSFLKEFFGDQLIELDFNPSSINQKFTVKNVFGTDISISNHWGYITIEFNDEVAKSFFLECANIKENSFSIEKYPCRIFPESSNLTISFYDLKNLNSKLELLNNRIITTGTIFSVFIQFKIRSIYSKIIDVEK